jgi:hypothetical protein
VSEQRIRCVLAAALAMLVVACARDELLVATMQASFDEQFTVACGTDAACQKAVATHGERCFDRGLALEAIKAAPSAKRKANGAHIRQYQACITQAAGTDHWAGRDMAAHILDQVGKQVGVAGLDVPGGSTGPNH